MEVSALAYAFDDGSKGARAHLICLRALKIWTNLEGLSMMWRCGVEDASTPAG
jgi:hypothetical protein